MQYKSGKRCDNTKSWARMGKWRQLYVNLISATDDGAQLYTLAALPWVPNGEENEWLRVCLDVVARMYIPASVGDSHSAGWAVNERHENSFFYFFTTGNDYFRCY